MLFRSLAIVLAAGFASPFAYAIGIGDISLQSNLGEPLRAEVGLLLEKGDTLDDKCLSLTEAEDSGSHLPSGLTAKLGPSGRKIEIRSRKPFNEFFATFRLQIKCSGMGSVSKTLTVLPEISTASTPLVAIGSDRSSTHPPQSEENPIETARPSEHLASPQQLAAVSGNESANQEKLPVAKPPASALPVKKPAKRSRDVRKNRNVQFRLKLSSGQLDASRIGTITAEQHESLLAQQLLLDEDDQTAHFLAMQHQLKLMQDELGAIKLKLATLENAGSSDLNGLGVVAPANVTSQLKDTNDQQWRRMLMVLGLVVATFMTWLGFRYFGRTNYQASKVFFSEKDNPSIPERYISKPIAVANVEKPVSKPIAVAKIQVEPEIKPAETVNTVIPEIQPEVHTENEHADSEENSVLEEAELYILYGHHEKAAKALQKYVAQHPQSEKSWKLMLSILSSRGQAKEFETNARAFLQHNKNSPAWEAMQALGRTLDKNNPLYIDEKALGGSAWLPLKEVQLKQQTGGVDALKPDGTPEVQQNGGLLKDVNPQRDGSLEESLMSPKVKNAEDESEPQAEESRVDKSRPLDFH